jgi:hypothetical protein
VAVDDAVDVDVDGVEEVVAPLASGDKKKNMDYSENSEFKDKYLPDDVAVDDDDVTVDVDVVDAVVTVAVTDDGDAFECVFGSVGLFTVFVLLEGFVETRGFKKIFI